MFPGISFWWKVGVISKEFLIIIILMTIPYVTFLLDQVCTYKPLEVGGLVVVDQVSKQTQVIHPYLGK